MKLGIFLGEGGGADLNGIAKQVADVERDGFESAWFAQIFGGDALTAIAVAGQGTSRIEFGTSVVPTYPRHPFVMAQQALSVQAATGGRLALGIGLSHKPVIEGMWGMSYDHPAQHMREYLSVLRPLVHEGKVAFNGEVFRVNGAVRVPGATQFPILLAALAPMMLRIAGELADGTVTWMTGARTVETHVVPKINAAAAEAGRLVPRVVVALPVAVTDDPATARERAAAAFAMYGALPNYRRMLDLEGAAGPADVAIVGDEAAVERQIRAVGSAGATDFVAAPFPAGADAAASLERTRALLKSLTDKT